MMMPSTKKPKQKERNWLDLPTDVTINILNRIGAVNILENAEKVCTDWQKICEDPALWRVINMIDLWQITSCFTRAELYSKCAMDRSQGQLVDLTLYCYCDAQLFFYAAARLSQLKRLEILTKYFHGNLTTDALMKFPLLEELNLYGIDISKEEIETVGRYCPMLKTLKVNPCTLSVKESYLMSLVCSDKIAIAIGQNLVGLRHLELIANKMTNKGLQVILDNCHHLETLDLRRCNKINLNGDLGKKCSEQIKHLKLPNDSLEGCPYIDEAISESSDEDDDDCNDDNFGPGFSEFDFYCHLYGGC